MGLTKMIKRMIYPVLVAGAVLALLFVAQAVMGSNIDGTNKYAWGAATTWGGKGVAEPN